MQLDSVLSSKLGHLRIACFGIRLCVNLISAAHHVACTPERGQHSGRSPTRDEERNPHSSTQ
eukprot:3286406-Pleurochrysis_carterae.AAC.3